MSLGGAGGAEADLVQPCCGACSGEVLLRPATHLGARLLLCRSFGCLALSQFRLARLDAVEVAFLPFLLAVPG